MQIQQLFGKCLYEARNKAGLTQDYVAEAMSISKRWYQKIEGGECIPGGRLTLRLLMFYKIDITPFECLIKDENIWE